MLFINNSKTTISLLIIQNIVILRIKIYIICIYNNLHILYQFKMIYKTGNKKHKKL